jgi:hypothetical protein
LESLDSLCKISGGHVRNLLRFFADWIRMERKLPLSRNVLEEVIQNNRNGIVLGINSEEWNLLFQVAKTKEIRRDENYKLLLRSMFIYEYIDSQGIWFDVNPILEGSPEFQNYLKQAATENLEKEIPGIDSTVLKALSQLNDQHEKFLGVENYEMATEIASKAYEIYQEIANKLTQNTDIYRRVAALSSYWKLMQDLDKNRGLFSKGG